MPNERIEDAKAQLAALVEGANTALAALENLSKRLIALGLTHEAALIKAGQILSNDADGLRFSLADFESEPESGKPHNLRAA